MCVCLASQLILLPSHVVVCGISTCAAPARTTGARHAAHAPGQRSARR